MRPLLIETRGIEKSTGALISLSLEKNISPIPKSNHFHPGSISLSVRMDSKFKGILNLEGVFVVQTDDQVGPTPPPPGNHSYLYT